VSGQSRSIRIEAPRETGFGSASIARDVARSAINNQEAARVLVRRDKETDSVFRFRGGCLRIFPVHIEARAIGLANRRANSSLRSRQRVSEGRSRVLEVRMPEVACSCGTRFVLTIHPGSLSRGRGQWNPTGSHQQATSPPIGFSEFGKLPRSSVDTASMSCHILPRLRRN
jgi:hypothetical protein